MCSKLVPTASFAQHIEDCSHEEQENLSERTKTASDCNKENLHITVSQNVVKESEDRKKPYTEYIVQIIRNDTSKSKGHEATKSKVHKRYKEFTELQQVVFE